MADIYGIMDIGVKSLQTQLTSMEVASHNIANANTPGYSRQVAVLETTEPRSYGTRGQLGTGVQVNSVRRVYDTFSAAQLETQKQYLGDANARHSVLQSTEAIFNEALGTGLGTALNNFFNAWESLAGNPESQAERQGVIQRGDVLASAFQSTYRQLQANAQDIDTEIVSTVAEVNDLTAQIADLNEQIKWVESGGEKANDLRDKRDYLIHQLSERIGIHTFEMNDGTVSVVLPSGLPLVESVTQNQLTTAVVNGRKGVFFTGTVGGAVDVTSRIVRGTLGGLLQARDTHIDSYVSQVNDLAARVIVEVNKLHCAGYGLDGTTNNLFFGQILTSTSADSGNTGGAGINSGAVADPTALTGDDYEIRFTAGNTYDVVNTTTGQTVVTGGAYVSGANITIDGITAVITDGGSGPAAGDLFSVGLDKTYTAESIALDSAVTGSVSKIAAAQEDPVTVSGVGDNRRALQIADLIHTQTMSNHSTVFMTYYSSLVSQTGFDVRQAKADQGVYELSIKALSNIRESISGVSIDEESANLIRFQNGYAAAARLINVARDLMEILVNLGR